MQIDLPLGAVRAGQPEEASKAFRTAISVARDQGARQFELRAAVSLAEFQQQRGQPVDRQMLSALVATLEPDDPTPEAKRAVRVLTIPA